MTTIEEERAASDSDDVPMIVASVIATAPSMIVKIGLRYLSMKRRARKSARALEAGMRANGLPEHLAHRLAMRYEEDTRFVEMIMKNFMSLDTLKGRGP